MEYLILIASLAAVVFGADILVSGSVAIARKLKVSDFVIGALIVGVGTSMPELCVSVIGAIGGNSEVAIGNVVGSNIFNVIGILGLTATIFPIAVSKSNMRFEIPFCIGISVLVMLLTWDFFTGSTGLGRIDGFILVLLFIFFIIYSFLRDRNKNVLGVNNFVTSTDATPSGPKTTEGTAVSLIKAIGGLAILIAGSHFFVEEAVVLARKFGVDDAFISITLIACGTSLPELAASIAAAAKKNTGLALGNIVGSNIFNISLILGLSSLVTPLHIGGITMIDYAVMIGAAVLMAVFGIRGKIGRIEGIAMVGCVIAYNIYLINTQL